MGKTVFLTVALAFAAPGFAGLIDHGDYSGFPNVNVDAHLVKIAKFYFPEIREKLPRGMKRAAAWRHDITEAAKGLDIPADRLEPFIDHVIHYHTTVPVAAPHEKLLEFELYARGRNELFEWGRERTELPPAWQQLFTLPVEKRRYVTIPVLYVWDNFCPSHGRDEALEAISAARRLGCVDTQGCELALLGQEPPGVHDTRDKYRKLLGYHRLFRASAAKCVPDKDWRHTNAMDIFFPYDLRGDGFYAGRSMANLHYSLLMENDRTLRELCCQSPVLRDLIVAVGLTNREMPAARRIAGEFALQSEINYPLLALRVSFREAEKLLAGKPEHAALLELLRLKKLSGMEKVRAIDAYIARFPDYTPKDMPVTSVALNTHAELQALAGLELFALGRPREALERWMIGGTPEDIGIVAEQIFTIDELIDFCRKHASGKVSDEEFYIWSCHCSANPKRVGLSFVSGDETVYAVRNILARRLMRERRFDEAQRWFTGWRTRAAMEAFMRFRAVLRDPAAARIDKLEAALSMAMLLRFRGDRLFGTFLEPDNVICHGEFPCRWGIAASGPKLNKPALPRFHYRWIAAGFYRQAAEYTDDPKLKGFCFWMAGTLLKNRDPKLAEQDFKKLAAVAPELTENNWFKPLSKCGGMVKELYERRFYVSDPTRPDKFPLPLPRVEKVELPPNDGSAKALLDTGIELKKDMYVRSPEEVRPLLYAFHLAGEKGLAEGYVRCGMIQADLGQEMSAIAYLRKALSLDPRCDPAKLCLGRMYLATGYWQEGLALVREVADNGGKLAGAAAFDMYGIHAKGLCGVKADPDMAKHYLDRAAAAGFPDALKKTASVRDPENVPIEELIRDLKIKLKYE